MYDNAAGDKIYVFWEKAYDSKLLEENPTLARETTTTSNLVELCWHELNPERYATCSTMAECINCGTQYNGFDYYNIDAHVEVLRDYSTGEITGYGESLLKWTRKVALVTEKGEDGRIYTREKYVHSAVCSECGYSLPVNEKGWFTSAQPCYCTKSEVDCITPGICDDCGMEYTDPSGHTFDHYGICNNKTHFQAPVLENGIYVIKNVGNLIWYSEYTNSLEIAMEEAPLYGAKLSADIDFAILSNTEKYGDAFASFNWTPISSAKYTVTDEEGEERIYRCLYSEVFDGNGYEIRNLYCESSQYDSIGLIGYAQGSSLGYPEVKNLGIVDSTFINNAENQYSVGAIVGGATHHCFIYNCYVKNTTVQGSKYVGGLTGLAWNAENITNCYAIDLTVTDTGNSDYEEEGAGNSGSWIYDVSASSGLLMYCFAYGEGAKLTETAGASLFRSYYLSSTAAEEVLATPDEPAKSAEQFANGFVAYYLGEEYGQEIGVDALPVFGGMQVYRVDNCGGEDSNRYTYSNTNAVHHNWDGNYVCGEQMTCYSCDLKFGEVLDHEFNELDLVAGFIWNDHYDECTVQTYCTHCNEPNPETTKANITFNFNGGVRADYVATVVLGGVVYTSEPVRIPIIKIQDTIGIEPSSAVFTGWEFWAKDLVTNTRMEYHEFDAYFLLDGEEVGESVRDAGAYDLKIVGKGNYAYQEYIYEDWFTVEKAVVEMTVSIPEKIIDGSTFFDFEISFSGDIDYSDLIGINADQYELPSEEVGDYTITGINFYFYYDDENNLEITHNTTAVARILPRNYVEILNKDYPVEYTYGDTIYAPTQDNFTVDEGSELTFEWYKDGSLLRGLPSDAGTYYLVVYGTATDKYVASFNEFEVVINPRKLTLSYDYLNEKYSYIDEMLGYDDDGDGEEEFYRYYIIPEGVEIMPEVVGFIGGDTFESVGSEFTVTTYYAGRYTNPWYTFPTKPGMENYSVSVGIDTNGNYEAEENARAHFIIKPAKNSYFVYDEVLDYDGEEQEFEAFIGFNAAELVEKYKDCYMQYSYTAYYSLDTDFENRDYVPGASGDVNYVQTNLYYPSELVNPMLGTKFTYAGTLYVQISAETRYFDIPQEDGSVIYDSVSEDILMAEIIIKILDENGASVNSIVDIGKYTVSISTRLIDKDTLEYIGEAQVSTATVTVKAPRKELWILPVESEYELDGEMPKYSPDKVVWVPGYYLDFGHRVVDMTFEVEVGGYAGAFNMGYISISDWYIVDEEGNDVSDQYIVNSRLVDWYKKYYQAYGYDPEYKYPYTWLDHVAGYNGMVHVYSNACDTTCNIEGCDVVRDAEPHTGGAATCSTRAKCDRCGQLYGDYAKDNHTSGEIICVQSQTSYFVHENVRSCCGAVISVEEHTLISRPTCCDLAVCDKCGTVGGYYDTDNHISEETYYRHNADDHELHDVVYSCCDKIKSTGAHTGGTATCTTLATCETCGLEYGKLDADNHSSEEFKYEATRYNTVKHDVRHACCGVLIRSEDHSGGTATCRERAECELCGVVYGYLDPETHHTDKIKYSPATVGNIHYMFHDCCGKEIGSEAHSGGTATCISKAECQHCGDRYGNKNAENHASEEFVYVLNGEGHDKYTACCNTFIATEEHSGGEATCHKYAECRYCGEGYGKKLDHSYDSACDIACKSCLLPRLPEHVDADGDKVCDGCGRDCSRVGVSNQTYVGSDYGFVKAPTVSSIFVVVENDKVEDAIENDPVISPEEIIEPEAPAEAIKPVEGQNGGKLENPAPSEKADAPAPAETADNGCGSFVGSAFAVVIIALAGVVLFRKKEEE